MKRRYLLLLGFFATSVVSLSLGKEALPNIVFILVDDMGIPISVAMEAR